MPQVNCLVIEQIGSRVVRAIVVRAVRSAYPQERRAITRPSLRTPATPPGPRKRCGNKSSARSSALWSITLIGIQPVPYPIIRVVRTPIVDNGVVWFVASKLSGWIVRGGRHARDSHCATMRGRTDNPPKLMQLSRLLLCPRPCHPTFLLVETDSRRYKKEQKMNNLSRKRLCCMSRTSTFPKAERQTDAAGKGGRSVVALSEVFAETVADAGAVGFVLSQLAKGSAPILWIQDRLSRRETGRPHLAGLSAGRSFLLLQVAQPADVLIAAEEGLRCKALVAVVAELWGDPPALNFTATKRLALRAEAVRVPCWLIRHGGTPDLSAARDRWRIASLPSAPDPDDVKSPGDPRWQLELFRSRNKPPGLWVAHHDRSSDRLDLSAPVPDGTLARGAGTAG